MKPVSGKRMCKALEAEGWVLSRAKASHHTYAHPEGPGVVVPVPAQAGEMPKPGTRHGIMKDAGLTGAEL